MLTKLKIMKSLRSKLNFQTCFWFQFLLNGVIFRHCLGIDGSQLLTHFPPNDNYCARLNPNELIFAEKNFKDKGRSNEAMMLFGYGDGGGGPTEEMVMRLDALSSGHQLTMPTCKTTTPSQFFQRLNR